MTLERQEVKTAVKRRAWKVYSAKEKSRAVLAVWTGRRTPSALCRELGMNWGALHGWEKAALEGIMAALEPNWKREEEAKGIRLGNRIEKLLGQTVRDPEAEMGAESQN